MPSPITTTLITKDQPVATVRAIRSVYENLFQDGDEVLVLDTGSSTKNLTKLDALLSEFPGCRVISRPELSKRLAPYIKKWLPQHTGKIEEDEQYADLRGLLSFSEARQVVTDAAANDIIFWLDSDDVLEDDTSGRLRQLVDEAMGGAEPKVDAIFLDYDYAHGKDGQCTTRLKRERFFFRSRYYWKGNCHETAIPKPGLQNPRNVGYWPELRARIKHTEDRKTGCISDIRNYIILRNELDQLPEGEAPDVRTIFYLANAARGLDHFTEAMDLYRRFECQSGSADDRYAACYYIAGILMTPIYKRPFEAMDWYQKCVEICPHDPRAYFGLARCYAALCRWDVSLHWYQIGCGLPEPKQTLHSYDPTHVHYHPHCIAAAAAKELGVKEIALTAIKKAVASRPNDETAQQQLAYIEQWAAGVDLSCSVKHALAHCPDRVQAQKLASAFADSLPAVPATFEKAGLGKTEPLDPRPTRPEIAFLCGGTPEDWGPLNAKTGIGGSERMVIELAPRLQALGYNVSVYAEVPPGQRGVGKDGVRWQHWSEMDCEKRRDYLVIWRNKAFVTRVQVPAKKRILWLHDVQNPQDYTDELIASLDLIQFQSRFHIEPVISKIPQEKVWIARNGIDPSLYDPSKTEPNRIVFASSPDRGVATALMALDVAQRARPDLDLKMDIAYGFTPFYRRSAARQNHRLIPDLGRDGSLDDFERLVNTLIDRTGATMHHRVGFKECAELMNRAGVHFYPTAFPEIFCMAVAESQAAGCIPVTTRFGALDEIVAPEGGIELPALSGPPNEEYITACAEKLIEAAEIPADDPRRTALSARAIQKFDLDELAQEWADRIGGLN